jgi:hypothetical protein
VSQISPPIRILVVAAVAVMGVYMLFLRPKTEVAPPAEPAPNVQTGAPAESQPGKAAQAAQGAVNAANGQLEAQESVDGVDAGEAAAGTSATTKNAPEGSNAAAAAKPAVDVNGLPKPIAKAIRKDKTLVLLFWNGKSADDKAVHDALKHVDRWDGRVYVDSAPIKSISKYGRIARGVDVEQSPTVVVVDSELRAEPLVGYVDAATIDQAVVDAFRNTTGLYTDAYLKSVDKVCSATSSKVWHIPSVSNGKEFRAALTKIDATFLAFNGSFAAVKAPKKWRAFRKAAVADNKAFAGMIQRLTAYVGAHPTTARAVAGLTKFAPENNRLVHRINKRFDAEHLFTCGSQF